jgi:hypothetical protein
VRVHSGSMERTESRSSRREAQTTHRSRLNIYTTGQNYTPRLPRVFSLVQPSNLLRQTSGWVRYYALRDQCQRFGGEGEGLGGRLHRLRSLQPVEVHVRSWLPSEGLGHHPRRSSYLLLLLAYSLALVITQDPDSTALPRGGSGSRARCSRC